MKRDGALLGIVLMIGVPGGALSADGGERRARAIRPFGMMAAVLVLPTTLLYMAYYWGGMRGGNGTMRFLLPLFPLLTVTAIWALWLLTRQVGRAPRVAAVSVILLVHVLWGVPVSLQQCRRLAYDNQVLARATAALREHVPPGSVVMANQGMLQYLDFIRAWRLADPGVARAGRMLPSPAREDDDTPRPMQAGKRQAQTARYEGLSGIARERAVAKDIQAWADGADMDPRNGPVGTWPVAEGARPAERAPSGPVRQPAPVTAVFCDGSAMEVLKPKLADARPWQSGDLTAISGRLSGRRVLLVHFGYPAQRVEEQTRAILEGFRPAEVIIGGAAGGLGTGFQPGDVAIAQAAVYHTYGFVGPEARRPRELTPPLEFPAAPWLVRAGRQSEARATLEQYSRSERKPMIAVGRIATVGLFVKSSEVRDWIRAETGADAVAMEGAIIAEACAQMGVPWVEVRSISDHADEAAGEAYKQNRGLAAQNGTAVVLDLLRRLDGLPRALTDEEAVRYLPDIVLDPIIETASDDGHPIVGLKLKNAGKVWCPGFQVQVAWREEETGNAVVERYSIEPLRPAQERRLLIQIPASAGRFQSVTAVADPGDEVSELDEKNNRASQEL